MATRGAAMADREEFVRLSEPLRRELLAYCYRMLGSVHDAEDLVQETYLRAWRSYDGFEGRSSLRAWLYRIATNRCLTALEHRSGRPLPSGLGGPSDDPGMPLTPGRPEVAWLQPIPDALLEAASGDPATIVASRVSVRLALIAALQHLPARQRVVLILRDVLAWRAAEVAELLDTSTAAVKSALQRARARLEEAAPAEDQVVEPAGADQRALLDRYVAAFEAADIAGLLGLLREDAQWEMPPLPAWFAGRQAIGRFLASQVFGAPRAWRMVPTRANGQPAFATYLRGPDGGYHAHAIQVLTVTAAGIAGVVAFLDPSLFVLFDLPATHDAAAPAAAAAPPP
jgi:RNA polymerase sigma-70 factor, ECF subfamily